MNQKRTSGALVACAILLFVVVCAIGLAAYCIVLQPPFAQPALQLIGLSSTRQDQDSERADFDGVGDAMPTATQEQAERDLHDKLVATPLVASCNGVELHSPIKPYDLTGILFHQASFEYALALDTELPEANYEQVERDRQIRVNKEQVDGTWLDADALHLWRTSDATAMETSIDIGAKPGTTVFAPVDGTVVLVKDYMLYDEMADIEIHIQPEGHPELDCVLIHTTDAAVKAGDEVTGGVTPISQIRDIEAQLTDVQLSFFVPEGVGGNHVHVQVNDTKYPDYRKKKLKGAYKVKSA